MRVVADAANVRTVIDNTARPAPRATAAPATAKPGLPMLSAILFLLACIGGGVAIAVIRPFGLG
ncbi:hypothetical protein P6144_10325 [Sphingomonas sp. HITSZ_GF]|uniref:hypothetical protein n=1 Tax=Sphingomonas sp. HITSZ_GF TaxID=3037247 RepID=UPI00240D783F|nr:hypothetical protein [Sphingomonas sp. HITSZ_GF]MDG2534043.1 hypothetical protein [Sphingomonas sp. HITSZ_GF]